MFPAAEQMSAICSAAFSKMPDRSMHCCSPGENLAPGLLGDRVLAIMFLYFLLMDSAAARAKVRALPKPLPARMVG